ncbi:hypothetical protein [Paraglaciecola sp. 2405UD69-4]|uniref:hypothetical protein n=1 Tax=Paraglaciecola sp. 2405UD69-4 TaxID=3391836 RepID=UPI0039C984B4
MRSLFLLLFLTPLSAFASQDCVDEIEKIKNEAEAFVLELNMDRVEQLFYIREKLNFDGGQESRQALDMELHMSIMEVLIKSKPKSKMISRIREMQRSFNEFPLQISDEKTKELNDQISSKSAAGI